MSPSLNMTTKEKAFKSCVGENPLLDHLNYHCWETAVVGDLVTSGNYRTVTGAELLKINLSISY